MIYKYVYYAQFNIAEVFKLYVAARRGVVEVDEESCV